MLQRHHHLSEKASRPFPKARDNLDHPHPPPAETGGNWDVCDDPGLMYPAPREAFSSWAGVMNGPPGVAHLFTGDKLGLMYGPCKCSCWVMRARGGEILAWGLTGRKRCQGDEGRGSDRRLSCWDRLKAGGVRTVQMEGRVQMKTRRHAGVGGWGVLGGTECMREGVEKMVLQGQVSALPGRSFGPFTVLLLPK